MGLYSITQTLSNPDCGLSKPHIPDNTPYISHRLIHSNRQGPHPQINHMTCLFFTHNSYHLFAFFHRTLLFLLVLLTLSVTLSVRLPLFVTCCLYLFSLLTSYLNYFSSLSVALFNALSSAVPLSLTALQCSLKCETVNCIGCVISECLFSEGLFSHLYAFCHTHVQYSYYSNHVL